MNGVDILAVYETVWELTRRMRVAAKESQWDELATLEQERFALVNKLMSMGDGDFLNAVQNGTKALFIRNILDCDAETRTLTEEWKEELRQLLSSIGTEKKLSNAYSSRE